MNPRVRIVTVLSLAAAALAAVIVPAPSRASVSPLAGVTTEFNQPMCDSNAYERIKTPATEYAVTDSAGTCVSSQKYHGDFAVSSVTQQIGWQYPEIASGYVPEGEATCADPGRDTCYAYPVRQEDDGMPVASFGAWLAPGVYNLSFDIWFSPRFGQHSYASNYGDTEVMVWLSHPGITRAYDWFVTVDGIRFGVMTWETRKPWRYVAYVALSGPGAAPVRTGRRVTFTNLWLNPFFRDTERHGYLNAAEWLQSIGLGFELVSGGAHDNVHGYELSGMR